MPTHPRLCRAGVLRSKRLSESFQRVTITGADLARFDYRGHDHWFRLFLPRGRGEALVLPEVTGREWWQSYLALPEQHRPHVSNYTVADLRQVSAGVEVDIDVVLHWDDAAHLVGTVARWACSAETGDHLAVLDQGVLFDPPPDTSELILVGDETAMPGLRGIVRDVPSTVRGRVLVEVPCAGDVERWDAPRDLQVTWLPRHAFPAAPGDRGLAALRAGPAPHPRAYAVVVGESALATRGRRWLVEAGLAKDRILFSGFYKSARTASAARATASPAGGGA